MSHEDSTDQAPEHLAEFDSEAFMQLKQALIDAAGQLTPLGVDRSNELVESLAQNEELCRQAWQHETHTQDMVELTRALAGFRPGTTSMSFYDAIPGFLRGTFSAAAQAVQAGSESTFESTLNLANDLLTGYNIRFQEAGVGYFVPLADRVADTDRLTDAQANEVMRTLFSYASPDQLAGLYHEVIDPNSHISTSRRFNRGTFATSLLGIGLLGEVSSSDRREKLEILLNEMTNGWGSQLITAWDMSVDQPATQGMSSVYLTNFGTMCALERAATRAEREGNRGICDLLLSEYTIRCFGRYSTEQLVDQYLNHDVRDVPYGVIISSSVSDDIEMYDLDLNDNRAIHMQASALGRKHLVRVYEASGDAELFDSINRSASQHGQISFMVLNGHSYRTDDGHGVALGKVDGQFVGLTIGMLRTGYVNLAALRNVFTDDAYVLFLHCGVGERDGLCQYLSTHMPDLSISGADYAYMPSLSALSLREEPGGGVTIDADFQHSEVIVNRVPQELTSITQHTYRNGIEVGQGKSG